MYSIFVFLYLLIEEIRQRLQLSSLESTAVNTMVNENDIDFTLKQIENETVLHDEVM